MNLKSILKEANNCIAAGDYEKFLTYCTEDTLWKFIGDRTLNGINEIRQYMAEVYKEPPKFSVELMIEEGNYLTVLGTISLFEKDSEWVDYKYCDIWRFDNGKLAELRAFVVS